MTTHVPLADLSDDELAGYLQDQQNAYEQLRAAGLRLDLTRGKPAADQLDLSDALLRLPTSTRDRSGTDVRNYGGLEGLGELREIFAELLGTNPSQVIVGGNSSLSMMHTTIVDFLLHGGVDSPRRWSQEEKSGSSARSPATTVTSHLVGSFGIEMVTVEMRDGRAGHGGGRGARQGRSDRQGHLDRADLLEPDRCHRLPGDRGTTGGDADGGAGLHHLLGQRLCVPPPHQDEAKSADILSLAAASGHPNRPIVFASTSKITYAGAGIAALAASEANIAWYVRHLSMGSIGPDKVNQLRHAEFFGSAQGVRDHMAKHRDILAPKFAAVDEALDARLTGRGIAEWSHPTGGYFVNLDVIDGTASRVISLAREAGIALTPAGAAFPHGNDPRDRNIRLAPSFPTLGEVRTAMAGVATCVALAAAEKVSADRGVRAGTAQSA